MLKEAAYHFYRFKYRYGKWLPLRVPVDVSLELSSACSMQCVYCYHAESNKDHLPFTTGVMKKEVAFKIIKEAAELGVNSLKFNWKGEGTMNPHYTEIVSYAKSLAHGSTFIDRLANSNFKIPRGKRDDVFKGLATLTKVKVSYDSFFKNVFETQRAGGDHDLTTENIDLFYNHPDRIKSETRLVIQAVRTNANKHEDIEGLTKARWPDAEISIRDMVEGRLEQDVSDMAVKARDTSNRQSCLQAHTRLIFNHKGHASPCCPDIEERLFMGDINTQSLYDIFNGVPAKELRRLLKNKVAFEMDPCKSCSSYETFKGFKPTWDS